MKKNINYLELTPVRAHNHQVDDNDKVVVFVPRFNNKLLSKFVFPKLREKKIKMQLDELGSATWLLMDGQKNVEQICRNLQEKFGEKINHAEERVTKFMTQLYSCKYINFIELKN